MAENKLKYLWAYSASNQWTVDWHNRNLDRRRKMGYEVEGFCVTPKYLNSGDWITFPELDMLWRSGDPSLLRMYRELIEKLEGKNVLILYNGANLHPEFVEKLKTFKVYTVADPECFNILGRPLCQPFDVVLVNQFSEIERYKKLGKEKVYFWPLGSLNNKDELADISDEDILDIRNRKFIGALFCNYNSSYRKNKLDLLMNNFPGAFFAGEGWPRGYIDWENMWDIYRQSQIGWNVHNSSGFNFRTYDLPSMGILQICDDKENLGKLFKLGEEAIGYADMKECVELTNYYLSHPKEQRKIALAGRKRWEKDYAPNKIWGKLASIVEREHNGEPNFSSKDKIAANLYLSECFKIRRFNRFFNSLIGRKFFWDLRKKIIRRVVRIKWIRRK